MRKTVSLLLVLLVLTLGGCPANWNTFHKPLVVYLVRHAEKTDDGNDPELSEDGKRRAETLAYVLKEANLDRIYTTDFKRTRGTAMQVAKEEGIKIETYDPNDLAGFAKKLKEEGGRVLVVGHSNTTPELTKLLGGDPGPPIDEKSEYDRLYVVVIGSDGKASGMLMRYGEAFGK